MTTQELSKLSMEQLSEKLQAKEINVAEFQAAVAAQQQAERDKGNIGIQTIKVSDKKALSVKLRSQTRFPTTLYAFQWLQLLENLGEVVDALYENRGELSFKDGQSLPERDELVGKITESLTDAA